MVSGRAAICGGFRLSASAARSQFIGNNPSGYCLVPVPALQLTLPLVSMTRLRTSKYRASVSVVVTGMVKEMRRPNAEPL